MHIMHIIADDKHVSFPKGAIITETVKSSAAWYKNQRITDSYALRPTLMITFTT